MQKTVINSNSSNSLAMHDSQQPSNVNKVAHFYHGFKYFIQLSPEHTLDGCVVITSKQFGYDFLGNYMDNIKIVCHGGITEDQYSGTGAHDRIIGFDTCHVGDEDPIHHQKGLHWTKKMVSHQCKGIIDQIILYHKLYRIQKSLK